MEDVKTFLWGIGVLLGLVVAIITVLFLISCVPVIVTVVGSLLFTIGPVAVLLIIVYQIGKFARLFVNKTKK